MACKSKEIKSIASSSDEETDERDVTIYCDVLTDLTPDIVLVLQSEISGVLSKCFAKKLIGNDMYERGTTLQPSQAARQLLGMVCAQIRTKPGAYFTFLNILRGNRALEHIPDRIEDEVKQKRKKKKKRAKRLPKASAKSGIDLEGYSSGFHSEYPSTEVTSLYHDEKDGSDEPDMVSTGENLSGGSISQGLSNEPIPFSGEVVPQEETTEENRELKDSEKIGKPEPEEESVTCLPNYQQSISDASLPVFANSSGDGYAVIHHLIEKEKEKADRLKQRLEEVEREKDQDKKKLEEELNKKEANFKHDIEEKDNEIVQLSKRHEETIMDMDKQHQQRIQELKRNWTMERETAKQKIEKLEKELQDAKDQNTTLQEEKLELEKKVAELEQKHEKEIKEEKDKHQAELEKMKNEHEKRITELNEGKKLMETEFRCDEKVLKMQHKINLMEKEKERDHEITSLKEEINRIEKENTECEARMKVQQEQMKTERLSHELKKAQSENELARNRERNQHSQLDHLIQGALETQRSLSSSSGESSTLSLTAHFLQMCTMNKGEVTSKTSKINISYSINNSTGGAIVGGDEIVNTNENPGSVCFSVNGDIPEDEDADDPKHTDSLEDAELVGICESVDKHENTADKNDPETSMDLSSASDNQEDNHNDTG